MRTKTILILFVLLCVLVVPVVALAWQQTGVTAEPYSLANLRPDPSINQAPVGEIQNGTVYPVVGRSEFFPWVLLGDPQTAQPIGWVFSEVVAINGDINLVPFSSQVIGAGESGVAVAAAPTATIAAAAQEAIAATPTIELVGIALPTSTPTAAPLSGVVGRTTGEVNIRYGPGVDYPRVGIAQAGDAFEITAYHTQLPWVQLRYDDVAGGFGWIAVDLLDIEGNIFILPAISRLDFALPTLTPTPDVVVAVNTLPNFSSPSLSPEFRALGEDIWQKMLDQGFEPETSRIGSLFLMDLQTGEAVAFGDGVAYSGMSLSKINILTALFRNLEGLPDGELSRLLASMMICSENTSSNRILGYIGGDPYTGATSVTTMLRDMGLRSTFMVAPFLIDPSITPQPVAAPQSPSDQAKANPDPFNQMTVSEMGYMLYSIYQCAVNGSGPLVDAFGSAMEQRECQQMLYLMSGNQIGALLEVGTPAGTRVAHKHGWVNETHGDAGIVFTPGGDYVLVAVLHNPTWLNFEESFPLIEDISVTVYNYFNPEQPQAGPRTSNVPEVCELNNTEGLTIIDNISRGYYE
ncbi:MAG: serine hydrolase [Chloroflexota bacterium]